jgi:hypothetical protein
MSSAIVDLERSEAFPGLDAEKACDPKETFLVIAAVAVGQEATAHSKAPWQPPVATGA